MPALTVIGRRSVPKSSPTSISAARIFNTAGLELADRLVVNEDEKLVWPEAPDSRAGWHRREQGVGDAMHGLVAGDVSVVLVQQAEVVEVDQGDRDRALVRPGGLDRACEIRDEGTVVQHPGQRVTSSRIEELVGLPRQAELRRPEDEEEQDARDEGGADRDQDHIAADVADLGQHRRRIAPDGDHGHDLAVDRQREEFAQQGLRVEIAGLGAGLGDRDERDRWPIGQRLSEVRVDDALGPGSPGPVAGDHGAIGKPHLGPQDVSAPEEGLENGFKLRDARGHGSWSRDVRLQHRRIR